MQGSTKNESSPLIKAVCNDTDRPLSVCFVCTGNTCRSPMAEAVLKHLGKGAYRVCSAGISAFAGDVITPNAVVALKNAGIPCTCENDYENHTASLIDELTVKQCDKIVAISGSHMMALICAFPQYAEKITVMPEDIPDPFMRGQETYDLCLEKITDCVRRMFAV